MSFSVKDPQFYVATKDIHSISNYAQTKNITIPRGTIIRWYGEKKEHTMGTNYVCEVDETKEKILVPDNAFKADGNDAALLQSYIPPKYLYGGKRKQRKTRKGGKRRHKKTRKA